MRHTRAARGGPQDHLLMTSDARQPPLTPPGRLHFKDLLTPSSHVSLDAVFGLLTFPACLHGSATSYCMSSRFRKVRTGPASGLRSLTPQPHPHHPPPQVWTSCLHARAQQRRQPLQVCAGLLHIYVQHVNRCANECLHSQGPSCRDTDPPYFTSLGRKDTARRARSGQPPLIA